MEAAARPHFGALLRQFRLDAGMTQQVLAERAKLSVEAISLLERGARTRPQRETVVLLGRALDLSPKRKALLVNAIGIAHPSSQRASGEALSASLLQVVRPDAQATARSNLPQQLTSFVGRQRELGEIQALLRVHRLVTVVGSGGVGKTRVAVQLGSNLLNGSPDGVWLADLAPLADETLTASVVLTALQLPYGTGSALEVIVANLRARRPLLILNNCEHVIFQARDVAASILESCPYVRILSTSREALGVAGERVYRLPSLAAPPDSRGNARDTLPYDAVELFVDRALAVNAYFALSDDNAPHVAEICRRLDGIPLAIELAAARVNVLAPRQIARRLDQRFHLLTGGDSRALPRHQTMTALMDWSYDLLTAREQRFFESLSTFAGGCTIDAATTACATEGEGDIQILDLVASLVTKSLLVAELTGNEERYRLLESSRQYARDKLAARGELDKISRRHAFVYVELAEQLERAWGTTPDHAWLPQAQVELENWRAALEWALGKRGDVILGQRLAAARTVRRCFTLAEGRRWVRASLELVDRLTPPALVARLEQAEADCAGELGEHKVALAAAERALARYRQLGEILGSAQAQNSAGGSLVLLGRPAEAEPMLREALATACTLGDRRLIAGVLQKIGWIQSAAGDFAGARVDLSEALAMAQVLGAESFAASVAVSLADNEFLAGNCESALQLTADLLASYGSLSASPIIAVALVNMAAYLIALGRYDEGRVTANDALDRARALRVVVLVALSLLHLALVAVLKPDVECRRLSTKYAGAARLFGFVDARLATMGGLGYSGLKREYDHALAVLRDMIDSDDLMHLMAAGAMMTEDEAIDQAHVIDRMCPSRPDL
jgi:predicted ATPase/transcriptional regulator with XRE-family HTH domain